MTQTTEVEGMQVTIPDRIPGLDELTDLEIERIAEISKEAFLTVKEHLGTLLDSLEVGDSADDLYSRLGIGPEDSEAELKATLVYSVYLPDEFSKTYLKMNPLGERQEEVFSLAAQGYSDQRIAEELVIFPSSVRSHLRRTYLKLGIEHNPGLDRRIKAVSKWRRLFPEKFPESEFIQEDPKIDTLSEREYEVLSLAAEGYTNTKIADELVISTKTVEAHLGHIYSKLEINSEDGIDMKVVAMLMYHSLESEGYNPSKKTNKSH